jgi:hypothetical protein
LVVLWYGLIPIAGAIINQYRWRQFRRRFDELRLRPILDYGIYRQLEQEGGAFRFIGGFESVTDGKTLWIHGENLTIPVSLTNAQTYLLPMHKGDGAQDDFDSSEEALEEINWNRVSTLTEGAKVFVGGVLDFQDGRWIFVSTKEAPLLVIFYDGPDRSLTSRAIRSGGRRFEYWNKATPYSIAIGALCQILIALSYLYRPAFRPTVITSLIALFIPLYPIIPPGILFTTLHRRLTWQVRAYRAYRDLARLPLRYSKSLPDGEIYGMIRCDSPPSELREGKIPLIVPEKLKGRNAHWYIFGAMRDGQSLPVEPEDPFATYGALAGMPEKLSKRYATLSYVLEIIAWVFLLLGIGLNIFFVRLILLLL